MTRIYHRLPFAAVAFFLIVLFSLSRIPVSAQPVHDDAAALEAIAAINQWRLENGLWPLRFNPLLQDMAKTQAQYVMSLPDIPDDIHAGVYGEGPRDRAVNRPFEWPYYFMGNRVSIGENAGIGNLTFSLNFWRNSEIHRNTSLGEGFREIGVAAYPYRSAHMYFVVFGARPNILPALVNPATGQLHLTSERYRWAVPEIPDFIHAVVRYRLLDASGQPLTADWQPWQPVIDIPANAGDRLTVIYSDGTKEVTTEVNLTAPADRAILPGYIPSLAELVQTVSQEIAPNATQPPIVAEAATNTPQAVVFATATPAPVTVTPQTVVFATMTPNVSPTLTATATPAVSTPASDLVIVYDANTLTVTNTSGGRLNIADLELVSGERILRFSAWGQFSGSPLDSFGEGLCLQAFSWNQSSAPRPAECRDAVGVVTLAPERLFWTQADFTVNRAGNVLATCTLGAGRCTVDLP
ncbi:MAG: CAP domain-containing protein [bacterium]|nr:CAP domain-containing protein [bacterium]